VELKFRAFPAVVVSESEIRLITNGVALVAVIVSVPLMLSRSQFPPGEPVASLIWKSNFAPPAQVVLPTVSVPGLLPGETVPPGLSTSGPEMKPAPPRTPPLPTVTVPVPVAEPTELLTMSVPPVIAVGPV